MVNHYTVLGVTDFASIGEIRSAYHKLSRKLHPDVNDGDPFFTEKFKEIQGAYELLTNSFKRQRYDTELQAYFDYLKNPYRDTPTDFEPEPEPEPQPPKREDVRRETPQPPIKKEKTTGSAIFTLIILAGIAFAVYKFISKAIAHDDKPVTTSQYADSKKSETVRTNSDTVSSNKSTPDTSPKIIVAPDKSIPKAPSAIISNDNNNNNNDDNYKEINDDYFTVGSTKKKVLKVQGNPSETEDHYTFERWIYPGGSVDFVNGIVKEFSNSRNALKIRLIDESEVSSDETAYFTVGSTKKKVLKVQGNPSETEDHYTFERWIYPGGSVDFVNGIVKEFSNSRNALKIRLIDESEVSSDETAYFTVGSTKKKVLKVQGNPSETEDHYTFERWIYPGGSVDFVNGIVKQFSNPNSKLKVKL